MKVVKTKLDKCLIIEPKVFGDHRGFFLESYQDSKYKDLAGITQKFVQDNHSRSEKNVLRGLHLQKKRPQGKLVRVVRGSVLDVSVDLRKKSNTYGQWISEVLSEENKKQIWIPEGFAHGFLVLSEIADLEYKVTDYFDPDDEICIKWNDPILNIKWPIDEPILSEKDSSGDFLKDIQL